MLQLVVIILFCVAAALFALTVAGFSLSIFARFLKRGERVSEEQEI